MLYMRKYNELIVPSAELKLTVVSDLKYSLGIIGHLYVLYVIFLLELKFS